jgi:hypothetical protein
MNPDYEEMTNAQLKEECEDLGIEVRGALNPHKPTKADYTAALNKRLNYEVDETVEVVEEPESAADEIPTTRKAQSSTKLVRLEMFRKDRVMIHDVQENQSKDKDEIISISWGNRLLGGQTDFVSLNGQPQYVRRGAINNMLEATTTVHSPKPGGNGTITERVKRFVITEVEGLTPDQLEELANKQKMRNSKYA